MQGTSASAGSEVPALADGVCLIARASPNARAPGLLGPRYDADTADQERPQVCATLHDRANVA